jgi:hypothetical protein
MIQDDRLVTRSDPSARKEAHQLRLGGMDGKAVLAESLRDTFQEALSISLITEPDHEVVRVADKEDGLTHPWLHKEPVGPGFQCAIRPKIFPRREELISCLRSQPSAAEFAIHGSVSQNALCAGACRIVGI